MKHHHYEIYRPSVRQKERLNLLINLLLAGGLAYVAIAVAYSRLGIVYSINDDLAMLDIAAGTFSGRPDGHLIFIKYPLGFIISLLFLVNRHVDWYGLTLLGYLLLCLALIVFRVLDSAVTTRQKIGGLLAVGAGFLLFGINLVTDIQFTTTAGALAATAIFWLFTTPAANPSRLLFENSVTAWLLLSAFCVRANVFYLALPFALVLFLIRYADPGRRRLRNWQLPVVVAAGIGLILLIELAAYATPAWQQYKAYNVARSQLFDYHDMPEYTGNEAFYQSIDISPQTYANFMRMTFILQPQSNARTYEAIRDKSIEIEATRGPAASQLYRDRLSFLFNGMFSADFAPVVLFAAGLLIYLLFIRGLILKPAAGYLLAAFLVIHFTEWVFLALIGRMPLRVTGIIYLVEIMVLAAFSLNYLRQAGMSAARSSGPARLIETLADQASGDGADTQSPIDGTAGNASRNDGTGITGGPAGFTSLARLNKPLSAWLLMILLVSLALVLIVYNWISISLANKSQIEANKEYERLLDYTLIHPDNFYFEQLLDTAPYTLTFRTHLRPVSFFNSTGFGGWTCFTPLYDQKLARAGISDVRHDLVRNDNLFVFSDRDDALNYLVDYYASLGEAVTVSVADTVDVGNPDYVFKIYRLHLTQPEALAGQENDQP